MEDFTQLGLPPQLLRALEKMNFAKPTPIQAQSIPPALQGRDILGSAQTGTGKTAAFGIPMITHLLNKKEGMALIMTPTRELAAQVTEALQQMLLNAPHIKTALLIGGQSMFRQLQQLRARPRIIVGTPGRINDHLEQRSLNLAPADFLVLDETDRMLDMGFGPQIERIVKRLPKVRQTLMFSATLPPHIIQTSQQYLHQPVRVAVGSTTQPIDKIQQEMIRVSVAEKYNALLGQLRKREGSVIVFVRTKRGADRLAEKLNKEKQSADAIHGNLNQNQRNRVIQAFRDKKHRIMVATDVACRGLDIPHIEHVINYDLPQVPEDYIHRIGRTARNGKEGMAVCFITPEDHELWGEIHKLLNPGAPRLVREPGEQAQPRRQQHNQQQKVKGQENRNYARHRIRSRDNASEKPANRSGGRPNDRNAQDRFGGARQGDRFGGRPEQRRFRDGGENRSQRFGEQRQRARG